MESWSQQASLRPIALAGLAVLLVSGVIAPPLGADTQVYHIQLADLRNLPADCGGGIRYNACDSANLPGFDFTDALPAGSTVDSVTVELNHAIHCGAPDHLFQVELNGVAGGTFSSDPWCTCRARTAIRTVELPAEAFAVRGLNSLRIVNPDSCQGLGPASDLGEAYARVTVVFTPDGGGSGGGGGDSCDLAPVLDKLEMLEASLQTLEAAASQNVAEHEATRSALRDEHAATRALVRDEAEALRAVVDEDVTRLMVERALAAPGDGAGALPASLCLPTDNGGRLETTIDVVLATIEAFEHNGCSVETARRHLDRGHQELADESFVRACDWYRKAFRAADDHCGVRLGSGLLP